MTCKKSYFLKTTVGQTQFSGLTTSKKQRNSTVKHIQWELFSWMAGAHRCISILLTMLLCLDLAATQRQQLIWVESLHPSKYGKGNFSEADLFIFPSTNALIFNLNLFKNQTHSKYVKWCTQVSKCHNALPLTLNSFLHWRLSSIIFKVSSTL